MTPPDSGERGVTCEHAVIGICAPCWERRKNVLVPLDLAQRILAALEREAETSFHKRKLTAVIAELRARMPK